jgi:hypothetical protein
MPGEGLTSQELYTRCCQAKESLHEYFQEHPSYDCQMDEKLAGIRCPRPSFERDENEAEYRREIYDTITSLISLGRKYLDYCLCSSLLPPCPEPVEDPRVPLAVITVCGDECKLMRVCNLDVRQYVITFPMIQHYLNGLGLGGAIMERLKAFCCPRDEVDPRPRRQILTADVQPMVADRSEMPAIGNFVTRSVRRTPRVRTAKSGAQDFSKLLLGAMAEPDRGLDTFKLLAGAMGAVDESGTPLATNLEIENPLQALMINGLVAPLLQNFIPQHLANATQARAARAAGPDTQEETKEAAIARMQSELEALRKTSAEQQENINMLLGDLKKLIETDNGPQSTGDK